MKGRVAGIAAAALLAGCGGPNVNLQDLLSLPAPAETAAKNGTETAATTGPEGAPNAPETGSLSARSEPHETSALVSGTPTGIFAEVARGALGCWFAADGPLKTSHIYRAEAQPPAKGGDAEIVIYERDAATRDLRGTRAHRVAFTAELASVRVTMTALRLEPKLAHDGYGCRELGQGRGELPAARCAAAAGAAGGIQGGQDAKGQSAAKGQDNGRRQEALAHTETLLPQPPPRRGTPERVVGLSPGNPARAWP